ncbi:MAG TPA: HEAT repeat domain-containing protein [Vicinamibacteria bacterium]|nr:HEAT repeat domain-containing protein [Vicinamibacteria bacterium]
MNLKDFLTTEGRLKFRIERNTKKLLERYAQHDMRMEAAEKLRAIGTPEAIYGLARRFSATSENLGIDQEEKKAIQDLLVAFGDEAVEPLKRYIRGHDKVTWAIDALARLVSNDALVPFLFEVLKDGDPVRIRGEKATQILKALENLGEPSAVERILPCLKSPDDTVRYAAIECLQAYGDELSREPLLEALVDPREDSVRVKIRIGEAFEKLAWDVKGYRKKVEAALPEPFRVNSKGRVTR